MVPDKAEQDGEKERMSDVVSQRILLIGLDEKSHKLLEAEIAGAKFHSIMTRAEFESQYEEWQDGTFVAIFTGDAMTEIPKFELAQVLLNQCPGTAKFYVTYDVDKYEPRNLLKNGFSQAFCLPLDMATLKRVIREQILTIIKGQKSFRAVRIFDLSANSTLEFDTYVFLPLNRRYIKFSGANTSFDESRLEKLSQAQMNSVFVDSKDMPKFYQYSAKRLKDLTNDSGAVSSTERQEKLRECVHGLFTDIFDQSLKSDFAEGKQTIAQCEGIISNYITNGASSDWYTRLMATVGESVDTYNHSSNVATFAALFAIGVGHPHPEDLAMAGLFHDLGMGGLPADLLVKPEAEWSNEDREMYYSHPEKSLNMIKAKRIIVSPAVEKAILQHHEKFSGKGYPRGLSAGRISDEAQILSFADQFDYLTRLEEGKPRLGPVQALEEIKRNGSINPEFISKFKKILEKEGRAAGAGSISA